MMRERWRTFAYTQGQPFDIKIREARVDAGFGVGEGSYSSYPSSIVLKIDPKKQQNPEQLITELSEIVSADPERNSVDEVRLHGFTGEHAMKLANALNPIRLALNGISASLTFNENLPRLNILEMNGSNGASVAILPGSNISKLYLGSSLTERPLELKSLSISPETKVQDLFVEDFSVLSSLDLSGISLAGKIAKYKRDFLAQFYEDLTFPHILVKQLLENGELRLITPEAELVKQELVKRKENLEYVWNNYLQKLAERWRQTEIFKNGHRIPSFDELLERIVTADNSLTRQQTKSA